MGILADTILEALGDAYDPSLERFQLTEQQLLDDAATPIAHQPGHTFLDVSPFVAVGGRADQDGNPAGGSRGLGPSILAGQQALLRQQRTTAWRRWGGCSRRG